MKKSDYFKKIIKERHYRQRLWLIRVSCVPSRKETNLEYPHLSEDGQSVVFMDGDELVLIEDAEVGVPLFVNGEKVTLTKEDIPSIENKIETTYRIALLNLIHFYDNFGDILPYQNVKKFTKKLTNQICDDLLREEKITVAQMKLYYKSFGFMVFLTSYCVPGSSDLVIRSSKKALEVRDKLLEEYKDQLDNPVIVAKIEKAIVDAIKEELKGDSSEGFFIKGKQIEKVRKMTHGMIGGFARLDDQSKVDVVPRSLIEGFKPEDMPALVNQIRSGSYDRGKDTALGGEASNFTSRVYQNLSIIPGDCGTKVGIPVRVREHNHKELLGFYILGEKESIKDSAKYIGKEIIIRDINACHGEDGNYCEICLGDNVANNKTGLGPQANEMTSVFLSVSLAAFHGKTLKTVELDLDLAIA